MSTPTPNPGTGLPRTVQLTGHVFDVRQVGGYVQLTVVAEAIPELARPGSFVAIAADGAPGSALLPRLMWVRRVRPAGRYGGTFDMAFRVSGPVTAWLAGRGRHDPLRLVGPLGRPFPLPRQPVVTLLAGIGHSTAPLLFLAEQLVERGCEVHLAVAADADAGGEPFGLVEAKRAASSITPLGVGAAYGDTPVARTMQAALERIAAEQRARVIYACGRPAFAQLASAAASAVGARSQVAVEIPMPCGTGACMGCAVAVPDGVDRRLVLACLDGPVFDGDAVCWDELTAAGVASAGSER